MKMQASQFPKRRSLDETVRRKLDRPLYTLLEMDDDDIRELVEVEAKRLAELKERLQREQEEQKAVIQDSLQADLGSLQATLLQQRAELLPHRLLWPLERRELFPIRLRAIVRFTGNRSDLEDLGVEVRTQAQDIFTITGTREQLAEVARQPACLQMRTPRPVFPTVDEAANQGEVYDVHQPRPDNPLGYTGAGVLLGVIDSALDVTHATFREAAAPNNTRVLYYWVQEPDVPGAPGQTPHAWSQVVLDPTSPDYDPSLPDFSGLNRGLLYTQADINTALGNAAGTYGNVANQISCEPEFGLNPGTGLIDSEHGTHCAGIAAGNGMDGTWTVQADRVGAAPDAVMLHVQLPGRRAEIDRDDATEDTLLDGIEFCRRVADSGAHAMPLVISISQGTNFGPHDGTQAFDRALDNMLNSWNNRSIVWSAGNDNDSNGFATDTIGPGATASFDISGASRRAWLDLWFRGPAPRFQITYNTVASGWKAVGANADFTVNGEDIEVEWDLDTSDTMRGLRLFFPELWSGKTYTIELNNQHASDTTTYYAWVGSQGWRATLSNASQNAMTISDTGCARSILTVGACEKLIPANPASGEDVTDYSGAGPTADGRVKPEIVAVGGHRATNNQFEVTRIFSAASDQAHGWHPMLGTSMSTPLVAGTVALLLEECAGLGHDVNQDEIKGLLVRHANRLNLDLDTSDPAFDQEELNRYGNGRMRAIGFIDQVQPPVEVDLWVRTADDDWGLEPYPGDCFCQAPDIRVCAAGTDTEIKRIHWDTTYDVKVRVRNLGDDNAVDTTVRLKYTYPHTAPSEWTPAEDASNNDCVETVTVNAMDEREVEFEWRPQQDEVTGAPAGQTHYCLLAEVDHTRDELSYGGLVGTGGLAAWSTNIKGHNNVALQNLHID